MEEARKLDLRPLLVVAAAVYRRFGPLAVVVGPSAAHTAPSRLKTFAVCEFRDFGCDFPARRRE
jgi:hypothetical protein